MASWFGNTDYQAANPRLLEQAAGGGFGSLKLVGDIANQMTADRLKDEAAARADKQFAMQEVEHQMRVDEQKRQLAETDNYKKFVVGLNAPKEMAEASALYNQNNNPILEKQVNDMSFNDAESAAYSDALKLAGGNEKALLEQLKTSQNPIWQNTYNKAVTQSKLGEFGSTMSAMPEFKETEYQKGKRILAGMGDNAPLAGIKQLREMEAAQIASDAAKAKDLTETAKHAADNYLKLQIEAAKHGTGDTITTTGGAILPIDGGKGKAYNPFSFGVKQTEDKVKNYEEGTKALTSRMDALGAGKAEDVKTGQRIMAIDALNKYAAEGYDPADLASIITTKFQADPKFYEVWKDKQTGIVLTPEELKPLEAKRTATATLDNMKLQEAQFASVLAQARNGGATGAEILKAYGPVYQNQIAKAEADKALLVLTPEQRQAQATMSYLGKMMAPKTEATGDKTTKGSSAETVDVTNMTPKLRTVVDNTLDRLENHHKATPIAAAGIATMKITESGGSLTEIGDNGTAFGPYQHRGPRLAALKAFGKTDKVADIPHETHDDFVVHELRNRPAVSEDFKTAYRKTHPEARFVSQWDELNSMKTAGEAAAYLSEYFEVAKGNSKNPNIVEARKEEGARRGKIAETLYANDYDEFGQNKRRIGKVEEEMLKSGPKVSEKLLTSLELAAEGDPYSLDTLNAKAELAALEKNKKSFSAEILAKPVREWSDSEVKKASVLPDIAKDKRDWTLFDIASSIGGNTPTKQDPAKTKALRLLEDMKQDMTTDAGQEEKGLESANLEVLPLGKMAKEAGSTALTGLQYVASKTPILNKVISAPVLPAPKIIESVSETLKRANDFNKIGIWRELRSRGVEVTDAMVEEILRKGNILTR